MGDNIGTQVGQALRRLREASGLTQEEAAAKAGIKLRTWCRYEAGENTPSLPNLIVAARAVGVGPGELLALALIEPVAA